MELFDDVALAVKSKNTILRVVYVDVDPELAENLLTWVIKNNRMTCAKKLNLAPQIYIKNILSFRNVYY